MRVERIVGRVNDFRAFQRHVLSDLKVHAAGSKPRRMKQGVCLNDVELVTAADRLVGLTEEVRVARVLPVHRLDLEANIVSGRFRIERSLHREQGLIQEG